MKDFFISYTKADQSWAEWIAWQLENKGYTTVIQAWDFHAGSNFVSEMQKAATGTECTIAVLSPAFLSSQYAETEWTSALASDPTGAGRKLIMVRIKKVNPPGLLKPRVYIDLVGLKEDAASERLLKLVKGERGKPEKPPVFPDSEEEKDTIRPNFPGALPPNSNDLEQSRRGRRILLRILFPVNPELLSRLTRHSLYLGIPTIGTSGIGSILPKVWNNIPFLVDYLGMKLALEAATPLFYQAIAYIFLGLLFILLINFGFLNNQFIFSLSKIFFLSGFLVCLCAILSLFPEISVLSKIIITITLIFILLDFFIKGPMGFYWIKRFYADFILEFIILVIFIILVWKPIKFIFIGGS